MISTQKTSPKSLSYWEYKAYFHEVDFTIVGAGLVGMSAAFHLKKNFPDKKTILVDGASFSDGASFKNAGFACFGSAGELLSDIDKNGLDNTLKTTELRINGLEALNNWLKFEQIDFQNCGSFELFKPHEKEEFERISSSLEFLNNSFKERGLFKEPVFSISNGTANLNHSFPYGIYNQFEGKIDTALLNLKAQESLNSLKIPILKGIQVKSFSESSNHVLVETPEMEFKTKHLILATNGFSKTVLPQLNLEPARAQVLITEPIKGLSLNSTYHLNEGYDYFRMIDNRILLGGGRNLALEEENTDQFGLTTKIQDHLEELLHNHICPREKKVKIDFRWSGIMGVGEEKAPLIGDFGKRVSYGIRMGGMGIAIGTLIGKTLANRLLEKDKA